MSVLTAIILVLIIIIAFFGLAYYFGENGRFPREFFRDSVESFKAGLGRKRDEWFTEPEKLYEKTVGYENDDNVKLALKKAIKKNKMFVENERAGRHGKKARGQDVVNAFTIGNIYRFNVAPNLPEEERGEALGEAFQYYNRAVNQMRNHPEVVVAPGIHADVVLDRVEDFYDDFLANAYRPNFNEIRNANRHVQVNAQNRNEYFAPKPVYSDPQNVHDSVVVKTINSRYANIKKLNDEQGLNGANVQTEIQNIRDEIEKIADERKKKRASETLELMNNANSPISSLGEDSEQSVLVNVWNRIHSRDNHVGVDALKESFIDALASGMERSYNGEYVSVCTQGRAHRVIDALTLMDANDDIAKPPKTREMYKNEIMDKAYTVLQDELKKTTREIAQAYNGEIEETPELKTRVDEFKMKTKDILEKQIQRDYTDAPKSMISEIIKDAKAGI